MSMVTAFPMKLPLPKQDQGIFVVNYSLPDDHDIANYDAKNEDKSGPATVMLDQRTGDIVWNAPGGEGEYNWAFKVIEWRKIEGQRGFRWDT
jgi:hypothetical protein